MCRSKKRKNRKSLFDSCQRNKGKVNPVEIKEEVVNDGVSYENNTEFTVFTKNNTLSKESLVAESELNELAP